MIDNIILKINTMLWGWPTIVGLIIVSIYLSIKLKFPQFKIFFAIRKILKLDRDSKNKITSFKALMSILAGTLGTGNITGIAAAIVIGGIGSLFWMFISGIFMIVISYAENYIVLKYRKYDKRRGYFGGTMYVLDEVLDKKVLAVIFSVVLVISTLTSGTMTQSNSLSTLLKTTYNISPKVVGILLAILTAYIVFGGKKRIAKISSIVIPICTILYIVLCFKVLYINKSHILIGIKNIIYAAFGMKQFVGGIVGISLSKVIGKGFAIGMFSNEAGMGTAPIFTATVEEKDINQEAKIAANSVIIDTLVLCMLTGITIVSTGAYNIQDINIMLKEVFQVVPKGCEILNICMIFFVIATIPCLEFYAEEAIRYLFKSNISMYIFRILYIIGIYIGSIMKIEIVWNLSGIMNILITIPNIYMVLKCVKQNLHTE